MRPEESRSTRAFRNRTRELFTAVVVGLILTACGSTSSPERTVSITRANAPTPTQVAPKAPPAIVTVVPAKLLGLADYNVCQLVHRVGWGAVGKTVGFRITAQDDFGERGTGGNVRDPTICALWGHQPADASFPPQLQVSHSAASTSDGYTPRQLWGFCNGRRVHVVTAVQSRFLNADNNDTRLCVLWKGAFTYFEIMNNGASAQKQQGQLVNLFHLFARTG